MEDYKKLYEDLVDRVKTMAKAQPLGTDELYTKFGDSIDFTIIKNSYGQITENS